LAHTVTKALPQAEATAPETSEPPPTPKDDPQPSLLPVGAHLPDPADATSEESAEKDDPHARQDPPPTPLSPDVAPVQEKRRRESSSPTTERTKPPSDRVIIQRFTRTVQERCELRERVDVSLDVIPSGDVTMCATRPRNDCVARESKKLKFAKRKEVHPVSFAVTPPSSVRAVK